ncbi:MAG: hypothetical protein OXD29_07740 [Roseovarius sp.]|nr:hypothetical protein [Roseovarius sp.]
MGKPCPVELRTRLVGLVGEDRPHRATATRFRVSIKFVNDMVGLKPQTGAPEAGPQGGRGHGKPAGVHDWGPRQIKNKPDTTLEEPVSALRQ